MVGGVPIPASRAARATFAPLTGVTNSMPLPGFSGVRRANPISVRPRAPALLELFCYASRTVVNAYRPDFGLRRLECHSVLHLENGRRRLIYSHQRGRDIAGGTGADAS